MSATGIELPSWPTFVQSYHTNKTVRYSVYTAGSLAIFAISLSWEIEKVKSCAAIAAISTIFYLTKEAYFELKKGNIEVITEYTPSLFKLLLVTSIVSVGLNGADAAIYGKSIVKEIVARNPYTVIKALKNLAFIGGYWAPLTFFCLRTSENYFYHGLDAAIQTFIQKFLAGWNQGSFDRLIAEYLTPHFQFDESKIAHEILEILNNCPSWRHLTFPQLIQLFSLLFKDRTKSFHKANPTPVDQLRNRVNQAIFYSSNLLFIGSLIYCHPIPTGAAFLCGLFYPTEFQSQKTVKNTWEKVPDFCSLSLQKGSKYIYKRASSAAFGIKWGYLAGFVQGLFLAESFRYYCWPYLASHIHLPIQPLLFHATGNNRWRDHLKSSFEKISSEINADPIYQSFKQRILEGKKARKVLDLDQPFTEQELKTAYRKWALKFHPDRAPHKEEAAELFKCLARAKEVLEAELAAPTPIAAEDPPSEKFYTPPPANPTDGVD